MPELPEVETMRADLEPDLLARGVRSIRVLRPSVAAPHGAASLAAATGMPIGWVGRRGKTLLLAPTPALAPGGRPLALPEPGALLGRPLGGAPLNPIAADGALLVRPSESPDRRVLAWAPRMTGSPRVVPADTPDHPHDRATIELSDGASLRLRDSRTFARLVLLRHEPDGRLVAPDGSEPLGRLGPEATEEVDGAWLAERFRSRAFRAMPLKGALLDQRLIAGIGNIYADELCWLAGLDPARPCGDLTEAEAARLARFVAPLIREAVAARGSRIRTYAPPGGAPAMQTRLRAYGRAGTPCDRDSTLLVARRIAGRTTSACPACQPGWPPEPLR